MGKNLVQATDFMKTKNEVKKIVNINIRASPLTSKRNVKENEKLNINNLKNVKNKIFAKDEFSNNRDLNENNNTESKNWYSNKIKEISKLNSRKEIIKRKHTHNTCVVLNMENLL